jgi:hypothetical protein
MFGGIGDLLGGSGGSIDDASQYWMRDQEAPGQLYNFGMAPVKKDGSQIKKHNGWEADVIYWDDMKPKSFKEKLQEEIDEWLEKVLD